MKLVHSSKKILLSLLILPFFLPLTKVRAQEEQSSLSFSAYTDAYYSYFTNEMEPNALQPYTTVSPRSKRFGLNVAQVGMGYIAANVRANLTLHWGDIAQATWSEEFTNIQEANVGFKIAENWWFDAGFFTTHIGTESFLPKNNLLSSTAVATYNEPFYQAGARIAYEGSEKFYAEFWVLNGYNRFLDINDAKSFGLLFSYNFKENTSLTYTNLLGDEASENLNFRQFRIYQNLYLNTSFNERFLLTVGGDLGIQNNSRLPEMEKNAVMYNALATLRYRFNEQWSVTGRAEVFNDSNGFISGLVPTVNNNLQGLELWGITLGSEFRPASNAYFRGEARVLDLDKNTVLFSENFSRNNRWELKFTMGYHLDKSFDL